MIGDGWDGDPSTRPGQLPEGEGAAREGESAGKVRVCVVTGTRAEFGLLRPVMRAIHRREELELAVIAAGSHLILPAETFREVKRDFAIADVVPMQMAGKTGRMEDVESMARGVARFGRAFEKLRPQWVVVLGDRIEAFAAGIAASVGGFALAHIHGGDRAEGVADEAMRHALTKLAGLHFPATAQSAERIIKMGEDARRVHMVGSPAMDELGGIPAMDDEAWRELGEPTCVFLMHPVGQPQEVEEASAASVLDALRERGERVLALMPNFDPGREGIVRAIEQCTKTGTSERTESHLPRENFVGLLKRFGRRDGARHAGLLVGNSSAGLIEAAALGVPVVDVGARQSGRERCENVVHCGFAQREAVLAAIDKARGLDLRAMRHPYGDGTTGERIAAVLASINAADGVWVRKRNSY
jgi:UDP-hydrolysing UDP-N-acetyl-D-glucosamine 2-epimerase